MELSKNTLKQIMKIVKDCEAVQTSAESRYTKEQEKLMAYDSICTIIVAYEAICPILESEE